MTTLTHIQDETHKITDQALYMIRVLEQKHKETLQVLGNALKQKVELKKRIEELGEENGQLQEQIETWKKKYEDKIYHNE